MADPLLDLNVRGAHEMRDAARALRRHGGPALVRRMAKNIRAETRPAIVAVRRNARGRLPQSGGLAEVIARSKMRVNVRTGANTAAVTITASNEHDIKRIEKGSVRHPLFGNRSRWFTQRVTPHWFTRPLDQRANQMRDAVSAAIDETIREIDRA